MSQYLTRIITSPRYLNFKNQVWNSLTILPKGTSTLRKIGRKTMESLKNFVAPGILFEEFGFRYFGPVNGHDLPEVIATLNNIKNLKYPVLLHVITQKGRGLPQAENDPTRYHGIGPQTASKYGNSHSSPQFLHAFGKIACEMGEKSPDTVFINAAMCDGTGLVDYRARFPERYFDVGIAEEHAVTFAGGLSVSGFRPVVAIYSTFMQRAFDQLIHDIALQNLPVIFVMDRAGLVGEDGPTHHGSFDLSYVGLIPGVIISAPRNGNELRDLLFTAYEQKEHPFVIRYPKDSCVIFDENREADILKIGTWETIRQGSEIAVIGVGVMTNVAEEALQMLETDNIKPSLYHARFIKPVDEDRLKTIAERHSVIITIEENSLRGGFGSFLQSYVAEKNWDVRVRSLGLPDQFVEHGPRDLLLKEVGLDPVSIANTIKNIAR